MGTVFTMLPSSCLLGAGCSLLLAKLSGVGCLLPLGCELAHGVTGKMLYSEGSLQIENEVESKAHWTVVELGIRSFSLNFCGRLNHFFDIIRRCLAPFSSWRSGRMVHDIVVAQIEDEQTSFQAFVLLAKAHNGDLEIKFCRDLNEVDNKGKPEVFGSPPPGWWKKTVSSHSLTLRDILDECSKMPTEYQPITNNCHHFSKSLWKWHSKKLFDADFRSCDLALIDSYVSGKISSGDPVNGQYHSSNGLSARHVTQQSLFSYKIT